MKLQYSVVWDGHFESPHKVVDSASCDVRDEFGPYVYKRPRQEAQECCDRLNLSALKGQSFPSGKYKAWIVDEVPQTLDGHARLVTADLKGVQTMTGRELLRLFEIL